MTNTKEKLREEIESMDNCQVARVSFGSTYECEIIIQMENNLWGLPSNVHDFMVAYNGRIVDFSHVDSESITIYMEIDRKNIKL